MLVKTPEEIQKMRVAGRMAAVVLEMVEPYVEAGISTEKLDRICHYHITKTLQAIPSTLHHRGFPASICTSVNHVVCHGIPSETKILKKGDIIKLETNAKEDILLSVENKPMFYAKIGVKGKKKCRRLACGTWFGP